jgi:hypothetical protein
VAGFGDLALWVVKSAEEFESSPNADVLREARMFPGGKLFGLQYNRDGALGRVARSGIFDQCIIPYPRVESRCVTKLSEGTNVVLVGLCSMEMMRPTLCSGRAVRCHLVGLYRNGTVWLPTEYMC